MRYVLDRFENGIAVIEVSDNSTISYIRVPMNEAGDAAEGDILVRKNGVFLPDKVRTAAEKRDLSRRMCKILKMSEN